MQWYKYSGKHVVWLRACYKAGDALCLKTVLLTTASTVARAQVFSVDVVVRSTVFKHSASPAL